MSTSSSVPPTIREESTLQELEPAAMTAQPPPLEEAAVSDETLSVSRRRLEDATAERAEDLDLDMPQRGDDGMLERRRSRRDLQLGDSEDEDDESGEEGEQQQERAFAELKAEDLSKEQELDESSAGGWQAEESSSSSLDDHNHLDPSERVDHDAAVQLARSILNLDDSETLPSDAARRSSVVDHHAARQLARSILHLGSTMDEEEAPSASSISSDADDEEHEFDLEWPKNQNRSAAAVASSQPKGAAGGILRGLWSRSSNTNVGNNGKASVDQSINLNEHRRSQEADAAGGGGASATEDPRASAWGGFIQQKTLARHVSYRQKASFTPNSENSGAFPRIFYKTEKYNPDSIAVHNDAVWAKDEVEERAVEDSRRDRQTGQQGTEVVGFCACTRFRIWILLGVAQILVVVALVRVDWSKDIEWVFWNPPSVASQGPVITTGKTPFTGQLAASDKTGTGNDHDTMGEQAAQENIRVILERLLIDRKLAKLGQLRSTTSVEHKAVEWLARSPQKYKILEDLNSYVGAAGVSSVLTLYAMAVLYYSWFENEPPTQEICQWPGLECQAGTIVGLRWMQRSLQGPIPQEVHLLSDLMVLDLSNNHDIMGTVPTQLGKMTRLQEVHLNDNRLSGTIPDLSILSNLKLLDLSSNRFKGELPSDWGQWGRLEVLSLEANKIQGGIPNGIETATSLKVLNLRENLMNGRVTTNIGQLTNLEKLILDNNSLSGDLSSLDFSRSVRLESFHVYSTNLVGTIPMALCDLKANHSLTSLIADCDSSESMTCSCCDVCY